MEVYKAKLVGTYHLLVLLSKAWVTMVSRWDNDEKYTCKELNRFQLILILKYTSKVFIFPFLQVPNDKSE